MHRIENHILIYGLAIECPFGGNPEDCQLHHLRLKSLEERVAYVNRLSPEELEKLLTEHYACFEKKV